MKRSVKCSDPNGLPPLFSKWRSKKHGTRVVVDHGWFAGEDTTIWFTRVYRGRIKARGAFCSLKEWREYQKDAKQVIS